MIAGINHEDVAGLQDLESFGVWGTVQWDLGAWGPIDELMIKSITAWRKQGDATRRGQGIDLTPLGALQHTERAVLPWREVPREDVLQEPTEALSAAPAKAPVIVERLCLRPRSLHPVRTPP